MHLLINPPSICPSTLTYIKRKFDGATNRNKRQNYKIRSHVLFLLCLSKQKCSGLSFFTDYTMTGVTHLDRLDKFLMPALQEQIPTTFHSSSKERLFIFTLQSGRDLPNRKWPQAAPLHGHLSLLCNTTSFILREINKRSCLRSTIAKRFARTC